MAEIDAWNCERISGDNMAHSSNPDADACSMDDAHSSRDTLESSPDPVLEQELPIFHKFDDLSAKVKNLKEEQLVISEEVKSMVADSFPNPAVLNGFQNLSSEYEFLKNKYLEECFERKRLYNEVIELKGNIRVFCRCRPLNQTEIFANSLAVVDFDSYQESIIKIICSDSSKKHFRFDYVFRPEDTQETVFSQTSPMVTSVLDGYNACIFAYGQTGTGKTFTMEGTPENRGVNYRAVEELFRITKERTAIMRYEIFVSVLEVYNETIRDLLAESSNQPAKKLEIKQTVEGTQEVPGLVAARVCETDEVWQLLKRGSQIRSVGSTQANELSSRSHCLLRVTVSGDNLLNMQRNRSHLWLVDLAGSERVGRTEVEGERLKESQFINKSLSALGDVIAALASKTAHVPYRNSKLTHLLQSSLGGDCKSLMFVQISPSVTDLGETLCSLNFASRVRGIVQGPARKLPELTEFLKYKQMAEKSKHDEKGTRKLQDNMQSLQLRLAAREHAWRSLQEKVQDLENQLAEERKVRKRQETRAIAAVSSSSSKASSAPKQPPRWTVPEKKPPLARAQTDQRMPLRRITNSIPSPSRAPLKSLKLHPNNGDDQENASRIKTQRFLQARRGSGSFSAVRAPPTATQGILPRRRASVATSRPEAITTSRHKFSDTTAGLKSSRLMGRQSSLWDSQRVWRAMRVSSPFPKSKMAAATEATPMEENESNGQQAYPSKLRLPSAVALQRKPVVWSPLRLRGLKNINRKSTLRPS